MKLKNTGTKINGFIGVVLMPDAEVEVTEKLVLCPAVMHQLEEGTFTLILEPGEKDPRVGYKAPEEKPTVGMSAKIIMPVYDEDKSEGASEDEKEDAPKKSRKSKKDSEQAE